MDKQEPENTQDMRWIVPKAYDLFVGNVKLKVPYRSGEKFEIEARSKIKSLVEALRQFEGPNDSVLHFLKYAEYYLPRSDMRDVLKELINAVDELQKMDRDPTSIQRKLQYLVGYTAWSMDALTTIFTYATNDQERADRVKKMIATEFNLIGCAERTDEYTQKVMNWYHGYINKGQGGRGR